MTRYPGEALPAAFSRNSTLPSKGGGCLAEPDCGELPIGPFFTRVAACVVAQYLAHPTGGKFWE